LNGHFVLYTLISLMTLLWSANFIIGKVALREFPPLLLGALRIGLAGLFLAPIYWQSVRATGQRPRPPSDVTMLAFLATCNVGNQLLFLTGLSRTSSAHSAWIIGTSPIFVLLIAAWIGLERITVRKMAGMIIALSGVVVLARQAAIPNAPGAPLAQATLAGDAITALATILFALFAVYAKKATERYGTVAVNGFAYLGGAALLSPIILWRARGFPFVQVSIAGWSSLVYMALFPSVVCYLIYYHALTRISASRLAAFIYLEPVIATLMAVAFLGERITTPLLASGTVIFSGVYLTERG
jgi:drug/metabolite transporter (DMT)-like permease